jgi:hypothetical protein
MDVDRSRKPFDKVSTGSTYQFRQRLRDGFLDVKERVDNVTDVDIVLVG